MRQRRVLLVAFLALAVPVAAASLAYACTALATLTVTSGPAAPGQVVTGTGKGFNGGGHGTPAGTTPVELRLDTRSGPLLATAIPLDAAGNIAYTFVAPNVAAGQHVLIGIQTNPANGTPFYGTPARQTLTILATPARATAERGEGTGASTSGSTTDPRIVAAPAGSEQPASAGAPAVTPAPPSAAAQPVGAPAAAASAQPAAAPAAASTSAAAVQSSSSAPASGPLDAGGGAGQPPTTPGGPGRAIGASSVAGEPTAVTTATPGLVLASSGGQSSFLPLLLLMLLGLGIGLAASARLITSLPQLRNGSGATAT